MLADRQDVALKRINIGDGETEVSKQYGIEATPTFHVYSADGKLIKAFSTGELGKLEWVINDAKAIVRAALKPKT